MHEPALRLFRDILIDHGHRVTHPRVVLFDLLLGSPPASMNELIKKAGASLDRVGMYRNIELFERLGIVRRIPIGWKYKLELSDQFVAHHHHLICISCGALIDINHHDQLESFITSVSQQAQFTPLRHHFEIEGYCARCSNQSVA